jgi:transposase
LTESEHIARLEAENAALVQQVQMLGEKVAILLKLLENKGVKKDSHNSHLPPSSDIKPKKNQSLREPSERKSGGQPGHSGSSLEMRAVADQIIDLKSEYCGRCGSNLSGQEYVLQARRQVIEMPPIAPITQVWK